MKSPDRRVSQTTNFKELKGECSKMSDKRTNGNSCPRLIGYLATAATEPGEGSRDGGQPMLC